jgi:hypothetical protein
MKGGRIEKRDRGAAASIPNDETAKLIGAKAILGALLSARARQHGCEIFAKEEMPGAFLAVVTH